jgi:hypothetical protein
MHDATPAASAALKQGDPTAPPPPTQTPAPPAVETPRFLQAGWSKVSMRETLPFCAFSSIEERVKAQLIEQVHEQRLKANSPVTFGVFGPWCLNSECDERPLMECHVEQQDAKTLIMHTHFFSFHKDDAHCTSDCLETEASCNTPELKPGKYTVRHGDKTYQLKIPSVLGDPCFNRP